MITNLLLIALVLFSVSATVSQAQKKCDVDHVCFAVDQSGSIDSDYPDITKFVVEAAAGVDNLTTAVFSAVGFSDDYNIIQIPTSNIKFFESNVTKSPADFGSTNMYAGMNQCYKFVENKQGNRVIVLVTDGDDNGSPTAESLVVTKSSSGVAVVAVGFGSSVDVSYLKGFSDEYVSVPRSATNVIANLLKQKICTVKPAVTTCREAYKTCEFKFKGSGNLPTFSILGKPDEGFTGLIVSKAGPQIGVLNSNGIVPEFINDDGTVVSITSVGKPKLAASHFKPFPIPKSVGSGIGHQTFTGNQLEKSRKRCVRVFFSQYQILTWDPNPTVITNVKADKPDNKCIVFRTA